MSQNLSDLTQALLSAAREAGAESADAIAVSDRSQSIEVLKGRLEHAERAEGVEIGLRVLIGHRQASVSASDTRPETIRQLAERAVVMAKIAPEDPHCGLADPDQLAKDWDVAALDLIDGADPTPAELEDWALRCEAASIAVPGVAQAQGAGAGASRVDLHLAASNGFSGGYGRTGYSVSSVAISGEGLGMERDYYGDSRTHLSDMIDVETIGRIAGERAVARAGSTKPPTGRFPVMFDERVSSTLIGHLVQAVNGASVARGSSWLKDALGEIVLPSHMTLTENPHRPRIGGSRPFDAEGLPVTQRDLVKDGVLQGWVLDLATGRKLGLASTGNASRGVAGTPSPSIGNLSLTQGDKTQAQLLADMGTGLLITSMIGSSINPTTGDYSRGASGFWIENGQIMRPVNECTIAGNLRDMLRNMIAANDARTHLSRVVPSLLIEGLTIAGA